MAASRAYDPLLPHAPEDGFTEQPQKTFDLLRVFPMGFTFCCLILLGPPTIKCIDITFDPDFTFWCGRVPRVFTFLPLVFILIALWRHLIRKAPSRLAVSLGLLGSSVAVMVLAIFFLEEGTSRGSILLYASCSSELERSWQRARALFAHCLHTRHYAIDPITLSLNECPGYAEVELEEVESWQYFAQVEHRHDCGGWCQAGPQLWGLSFQDTTACSRAVGDVFVYRIKPIGLQLLLYSFTLLILTTLGMVAWGPRLRRLGLDW
mmetsp:Transcript_135481/g.377330  ORF Transcript_135481/g.377330 Transcript_135481/m.377330 type:complete len:264 (-) Transcript_135481:51-842(-)